MKRREGMLSSAGRRCRAVALVMTFATTIVGMVFASGAAAMSPFLFFQQVGRVGLLCSVDADPERAGIVEEAALCGLAESALTALLGSGGPPATVFGRNDERIADPATLLLLIHATLRPQSPAERGAATGNGTVLALSAALQRVRTDLGAPPFFAAAPQAVVAPGGKPDTQALQDALGRLLAGVARPLLANRPAAK